MNTQDWFLRKYPTSGKKFVRTFGQRQINDLKRNRWRIGTIIKDTWHYGRYPKGTPIIWWRKKNYWEEDGVYTWDGTFDTLGIVKCEEGITASGYHCIYISDRDIKEIKK